MLGVENVNVVRHVGHLCDGVDPFEPFMFMNDGDLLALVTEMVFKRGLDTARVTQEQGHDDAEMVLLGQVEEDDRIVMIWRMRLLILDGGGRPHNY